MTGDVVGIADSDWPIRDKTEKNIVFHFFWPIFGYLCTPSVAYTWSVCPLICKSSVRMIKFPLNKVEISENNRNKKIKVVFFDLNFFFPCRS